MREVLVLEVVFRGCSRLTKSERSLWGLSQNFTIEKLLFYLNLHFGPFLVDLIHGYNRGPSAPYILDMWAGCLFIVMLFDAAFNLLCQRLSFFHPFSLVFRVELQSMMSLVELRKGEVMVAHGQRQTKVWFLCEGHAKEVSSSDQDGREHVSWFWFAGDFIFSYPGFFAQEPAIADIVLIEDCVLLEISFEGFVKLREEFAEVTLLVEKIRSYYERLRVGHASDLVNLSARERYQKFFAEHKSLFNSARHRDIASFLGIRNDGFNRYYSILGL